MLFHNSETYIYKGFLSLNNNFCNDILYSSVETRLWFSKKSQHYLKIQICCLFYCLLTSSITLPWAITRLTLTDIYPFCNFCPTHCRMLHNTFILAFQYFLVFNCFTLSFVISITCRTFICCCSCCCIASARDLRGCFLPSFTFLHYISWHHRTVLQHGISIHTEYSIGSIGRVLVQSDRLYLCARFCHGVLYEPSIWIRRLTLSTRPQSPILISSFQFISVYGYYSAMTQSKNLSS